MKFLLPLLLGIIIGVIGTFFVYPFIFPPPMAHEEIQDIHIKKVSATGKFIHINKWDPVHWGRGRVEVYQHKNKFEILLNKDFEVGPGPDYHIYLSEHEDVKTVKDFKENQSYDLGSLRSFKGSQVYPVNNIDMNKVKSVVIWCQSFSVLISSAKLNKEP